MSGLRLVVDRDAEYRPIVDPDALHALQVRARVGEASLSAIRRNCVGRTDPLAVYCLQLTDHLED